MTDIREPEPGIYFGMPAEEYHAIPALSQSLMKWLHVSPLDFWAVCPWLNPDYEEDSETEAKKNGTAFHDRIVEGRDAFYARNAPEPDPDDYPEALHTQADLKEACKARGLKVGGNKPELIARLIEAEPLIQIWDVIVDEYVAAHEGKTLLSADQMRRIEIAAAMIERHPQLSKAFAGGMPEVVIVWRDPETGVMLKCRLDYLKVRSIVELKSLSNPLNKPADRAIYHNFGAYKHFCQAAHYLEGAAQIPTLLTAGRVHGDHDSEWLKKVARSPKEFLFVYQFSGRAPVAKGRTFSSGLVFDCGKIRNHEAIRIYRENLDRFGSDPWVDLTPIEAIDDNEVPVWATME